MDKLLFFINKTYAAGSIQPYTPTCGKTDDCIATYLGTIATFLTDFVAALAVLFIIIGGVLLMTSRGSQTQTERGKKTLTYAIIGLVIIILSRLIFFLITNNLSSFFG